MCESLLGCWSSKQRPTQNWRGPGDSDLPGSSFFLFEGVRKGAAFRAFVAESSVASHEVRCCPECYEHRGCKPIRLLAPTSPLLFPTGRWSCLDTGPRSLAFAGSSSHQLYVSYRVRDRSEPSLPVNRPTTFPKVSFPTATPEP